MEMSIIYWCTHSCTHLSSKLMHLHWVYIQCMHSISNFVACPCSCMADCCIWLFFWVLCICIMPTYCIENIETLGCRSIDIASIYHNDIALVITHYYLANKEMIRRRIVYIVVSFISLYHMMSMVPITTKTNSIFGATHPNNTKVDCCILCWL